MIRLVYLFVFVFISSNVSLFAQKQVVVQADYIDRTTPAYLAKQHIKCRGNLNNSRFIFEKEKVGRVAFLGGSITEMRGWRDAIVVDLKLRFPKTRFDFVSAGIGSTGSTPGAFRFEKDVLIKGKVDLLFVEAAVNDYVNGFDTKEQIRGMEGIVRQALKSNPNMDIIMQHFICDAFIPVLNSGDMSISIINHEKVADYYQISSINQAQEIAERMKDGEFDWRKFGGIHPAPFGQTFYVASIKTLFEKMWATTAINSKIEPHVLPAQPIDKFSYYNAKLVDPSKAVIKNGWAYETAWKPKDEGVVRRQFQNVNILETLIPGAELTFEFGGTTVGIYALCGPNAGILEYSIDSGKFKQYDLFTRWSKNLYLPWVCMLGTELADKNHKLTIRMSAVKNTSSKGTACNIYYFAVNGVQ
jgi:hypothetical protein